MEKKLIVKIRENKSSGQKLITIPKHSILKVGDYVIIELLPLEKSNECLSN